MTTTTTKGDAREGNGASTQSRPRRTAALVIGAGPAGLAAAACLRRAEIPFLVVEKNPTVGSSWRGHYERLHLHTVKEHSSLPYRPFPDGTPRYVPRQQVVSYLDDYARFFEIEPHFGVTVKRAYLGSDSTEGGRWMVDTDAGAYKAQNVIVATGYNGHPHRPPFEGIETFAGPVIHTSEYHSGSRFRGQRVLVVGCGNSGAEIAIDLHEQGARPTMVVRGPVHVVPRDLLGTPSQVTGLLFAKLPVWLADAILVRVLRLAVGDLSRYGIVRPEIGPVTQINEKGRVPMLDIGTIALIKRGEITVVPQVARFVPTGAVFVDGRELPFDAVVMATGFRPNLEWLAESAQLVNALGYPKAHGREALPGLYFIGFRNPPTGALREMGIEARRIADSIGRQRAMRAMR